VHKRAKLEVDALAHNRAHSKVIARQLAQLEADVHKRAKLEIAARKLARKLRQLKANPPPKPKALAAHNPEAFAASAARKPKSRAARQPNAYAPKAAQLETVAQPEVAQLEVVAQRKADPPPTSLELNALTEAEPLKTTLLVKKPALFVPPPPGFEPIGPQPSVPRDLDPKAESYKPTDLSGELAASQCSISWMANRISELNSRVGTQCGRPRHRRPSRSLVAKKHARQIQRLVDALAALKSRFTTV